MMLIYKSNANLQIANKDIRDSRHSHEIHILASQNGSIIIFTVLIIASILSITLALTRIFIPRIRSITEATDSIGAVYAADSAMEWCLYNNQISPSPTPWPSPSLLNGATFQVTPSNCSGNQLKSLGTYKGATRQFEVNL